tara:strand:- start:2808 stop:3245 length:438 start_codon:yes stop_codon:yes gene_type:complete
MNITLCTLSIILLISNILFLYFKSNESINTFKNKLTDEQLDIYKRIYSQRLYIYTSGIILGIIIAYIYVYLYTDSEYRLCKFIGIILIVKVCFYYFYPKHKLMLYFLNTKDQFIGWADIYTSFKEAWKVSLLISIISYIILYYGL